MSRNVKYPLSVGSFTFVSAISFFTGFSFSQKSSDSRPSRTVLAATKGGMFNLKKQNKTKHTTWFSRKTKLFCCEFLNHDASPWAVRNQDGNERTAFILYLGGNGHWGTWELYFCRNFHQRITRHLFFCLEEINLYRVIWDFYVVFWSDLGSHTHLLLLMVHQLWASWPSYVHTCLLSLPVLDSLVISRHYRCKRAIWKQL